VERAQQGVAAGGCVGTALPRDRSFERRQIDGRASAFMQAGQPGVERTGEVAAALVERGDAPLPDDGGQGGVYFLPRRDHGLGDLRGIRIGREGVRQRNNGALRQCRSIQGSFS